MDDIVRGLYKKYKVCTNCHKEYGSDHVNDNGWCPICDQKNAGRHSQLERKH